MKNKNIFLTSLFLTVTMTGSLVLTQSSFSQEKVKGWTTSQQQGDQLFNNKKEPVNSLDVPEISPQIQILLEQIKSAKSEGNIDRVMQIQKQIDVLTGESITIPLNSPGGEVINRAPGDNGDAIVNSLVFANPPGTTIKAMTTGTEQRGLNIGRIWVAFAYGTNNNSSADTIKVYHSEDGGYHWSLRSTAIVLSGSKVNYDEMDMEIMEYTTGQKYLWITDGITTNTSQKISQVLILQTDGSGVGFYNLYWPGDISTNNVYMPRITTDNSNYPTSSSYCFIIAARDSATSGGHYIGEKYAYCVNPFTTTPTLTFRGPCYYYNVNYGNNPEYDNVDIAYFRNGGQDSIIVTESNLPNKSYVFCMKDGETGANPFLFSSLNWGNTYAKQYARVASNGSFPLIMIAFRQNYNNNGDWDIAAARSLSGGVTSAGWLYSYIDSYTSTLAYPFQPDLWGTRNSLSFKCSYVYYSSGLDSSMVSSVGSSGIWDTPSRINNTGEDVSYGASSHICANVNNNDCFTVWSNYSGTGGDKVWAAAGCTAPFITGLGNNNNEVPAVFSLSQNYPNPFNPNTNIGFRIADFGFVSLKVYDIMGKEAAVLVNENFSAGVYNINFDAGNFASGMYFYKLTFRQAGSSTDNFSETKKMLLIK